jgi:hypothetical protein
MVIGMAFSRDSLRPQGRRRIPRRLRRRFRRSGCPMARLPDRRAGREFLLIATTIVFDRAAVIEHNRVVLN